MSKKKLKIKYIEVPFATSVGGAWVGDSTSSSASINSTKLLGKSPTFPFKLPLHHPSSSSSTSSIISPTFNRSSSNCSGSYSNVTLALRPETEAKISGLNLIISYISCEK